jgi:prepilin-type N-terminal cleavage/methylation domain-containing protein
VMRHLLRFLRVGRKPEQGFTLVEMMVASALLSLVTIGAFGTLIQMQHEAVITTDRFTAEGEAQTIADRITKDLRTAVAPSSTEAAFASATSNDVTFYASLADPNGPTKLHAYVSAAAGNVSVFHEDSTRPDPGGSPGNYTYTQFSSVVRLDGRYLDSTSPVVFTYFDANDNPLSATQLTTLAGRRSIDSVGINLRVRVRPGSPVVVITTRIHARNVDYNPNT